MIDVTRTCPNGHEYEGTCSCYGDALSGLMLCEGCSDEADPRYCPTCNPPRPMTAGEKWATATLVAVILFYFAALPAWAFWSVLTS
jgi:hypothetical protein